MTYLKISNGNLFWGLRIMKYKVIIAVKALSDEIRLRLLNLLL
jgi:hypothetical protein